MNVPKACSTRRIAGERKAFRRRQLHYRVLVHVLFSVVVNIGILIVLVVLAQHRLVPMSQA